jgi:hypothetical protein
MPWQLAFTANDQIVADSCHEHDFHESDKSELQNIALLSDIPIRQLF